MKEETERRSSTTRRDTAETNKKKYDERLFMIPLVCVECTTVLFNFNDVFFSFVFRLLLPLLLWPLRFFSFDRWIIIYLLCDYENR